MSSVQLMRILVIVPAYEPAWSCGGVVRSLSTLCKALAKQGVPVTVYTTNASGGAVPLDVALGMPIERSGVRVFYFPSTFGSPSMFDSRDLRRALEKTVHDFDVVYIAAWFMWLGIAAAAICRKAQVPVIAGTHGGFTEAAVAKSHLAKVLFRELFLKRAFKNVAAFRVTSAMEETCSRKWLGDQPCIVVPNAVEPETFHPCLDCRDDFRGKYGIPSETPVLITVTRFDWMKRVDLLMDCLAHLPAWRLVLVGDDRKGTGPALKSHAKRIGVEERVVWTGHLEGESLRAALSASDLFTLISETDNFGNVVVEAMMCGLPVLISKQVGVAEFIDDLSFVSIADNSVESIVERVLPYERTRVSDVLQMSRIRESAIERFSPESVAKHFIDSVQGVLDGTARTQDGL